MKEKVIGRVPVLAGRSVEHVDARDSRVHLTLRADDGASSTVVVEHVIAATGYKVDLQRLTFLSDKLRGQIKAVESTPILSARFESSVPGLHFSGPAAASSFGPVMRFAFGARFSAQRLTAALLRAPSRH